MADQLTQGDDEIKNSAATAESSSVSEQAHNNLMKDFLAESIKKDSVKPSSSGDSSAQSAAESKIVNSTKPSSSDNQSGSAASAGGGIAESLQQLIKDGKNPANSAGSESNIKEHLKDLAENGKLRDLLNDKIKPDGVKQLPTGDTLVRDEGKETLFTPKGDKVTVNPDGTFKVKGDVKSVSTDKTGATTITFGDGAKVTIDKEGIRDVSRGNQSISFMRHSREKINQDGSPAHGGGVNELPRPIKPGHENSSGNSGGHGGGVNELPRPTKPQAYPSDGNGGEIRPPKAVPAEGGSRPESSGRDSSPSQPPRATENSAQGSREQFRPVKPLKPILPNIEIK
jgi:hypothetical protein